MLWGPQAPLLTWTWREVGCQGSAADFNCSCTISARPGDFQGPGGMDASQLRSVTSDGWMHPHLLQHRTHSIPKLSGYLPQSQQSTLISWELMEKATLSLHPFSRQQSFSAGEGKQLLSKLMGYGGLHTPGRHSPAAAPAPWPALMAMWQLVPAGERDVGFGSRWWPAVGCVCLSPGEWILSHQSNGIRINDCCSIPGPALPSFCTNQIQHF